MKARKRNITFADNKEKNFTFVEIIEVDKNGTFSSSSIETDRFYKVSCDPKGRILFTPGIEK